MHIDFTDDQLQLRDSVRRRFGPRGDLRAMDPVLRWGEYAEAGLLNLSSAITGTSTTSAAVETMIVMEEVGRAGVKDCFIPTVVQAADILRQCAPTPLALRTMAQMRTGHARLAVVAEPDAPRVRVRARTVQTGGWKLRGRGQSIAGATDATQLLVLALQSNDAQAVIALVDRQAPGVEIDPIRLTGDQGIANVVLHDVALDEAHCLAQGAEAMALIHRSWDHAILARCAEAVGAASAVLSLSVSHLRGRGAPTGACLHDDGASVMVTDGILALEVARSAVIAAASACAHGSAVQREIAVSQAKLHINRIARLLPSLAESLHGGAGLIPTHHVGALVATIHQIAQLDGDDGFHLRRLWAYVIEEAAAMRR